MLAFVPSVPMDSDVAFTDLSIGLSGSLAGMHTTTLLAQAKITKTFGLRSENQSLT